MFHVIFCVMPSRRVAARGWIEKDHGLDPRSTQPPNRVPGPVEVSCSFELPIVL